MITLRPAENADAAALGGLFTASRALLTFLPALHSPQEDAAFITRHVLPVCRVTVAAAEGTVVGFIAESPAWIEHLYVAPEAIAGGVGSKLLEAAKGRQLQLDLWCFDANLRGRRFYEARGFLVAERTDGSRNEERLPDIRYRWTKA